MGGAGWDVFTKYGIGVTSGLITALLVFVIRGWWFRILQPWFEKRVYQDSRIDETWFAYIESLSGEAPDELIWDVKQVGHKVYGTITCLNGTDKGKKYDLKGSFHNLILTAEYQSADRRDLDRGTVALMVNNNGQTLKGHCAYYSASKHEIANSPYECNRSSRAQKA